MIDNMYMLLQEIKIVYYAFLCHYQKQQKKNNNKWLVTVLHYQ